MKVPVESSSESNGKGTGDAVSSLKQERPVAVECRGGDDTAHSSVAPLQASEGDGAVPWPQPLLSNGASSNPKRFDPGGHTSTENSRLPGACESESSKGPLCVSSFFLKCKSERRS